ncbi:MAG: hypothetical protein FJY95_15240 [Candidatus Handelsmanbacteria bacterium]|nr:hypothetical protein [Candidatus Handelsmanbacteria bacterium]
MGKARWGDFAAAHYHWRHSRRLFSLSAGDPRPGFGQGLVFGRPAGAGAGPARPGGPGVKGRPFL